MRRILVAGGDPIAASMRQALVVSGEDRIVASARLLVVVCGFSRTVTVCHRRMRVIAFDVAPAV
jgi:hypothetical protein